MGQIVEYQTGDGTVSSRDYDNLHRLDTLSATNGGRKIQDFVYGYDDFSNLAARTENKYALPMTERFTYDRLNRLDSIKFNSVSSVMTYDPHGRMLSKQADGQMVFSGAQYNTYDQLGNLKPHAISSATVTSGTFPTPHMEAEYTTFDKVKNLTKYDGNNNVERTLAYTYGYDHQRIGMEEHLSNSSYRTKTYVGNCEFNHDFDCARTLTYLNAPTGLFAVHMKEDAYYVNNDSQGSQRLLYLHKDHLGSITTITDTLGNIVQELSYDAWGNLRNPITWSGSFTDTPLFDRGFTGHEHLYGFGLINMNGRMYDPFTSGFLSVDNYVQSPDYTQSFNRYAYCLNNPLKYTDPNGEFFILDAWLSGFFQGFFSTDENRLSNGWNKANQLAANDAKILGGLFIPDMNKGFFGRHWQVLSRLTWEAPQTTLGSNISLVNNLFGQVDKVEYYDGSTVCSGNFWGMGSAVTLGCYINGSGGLSANPNNTTFQHEYGHYLQSQKMGIAYLNRVGIPSLFSNHNHDFHPVEQDANRRAFLYFNEHVEGFYKSEDDMHNDGGWDFFNNPLNIKGIIERDQYVDYYDASSLQLLDKLSIHAKWYDYASYSCLLFPIGPMAVGLFNSIYYNANY